jgi:predicted aconitase with swiveling domain
MVEKQQGKLITAVPLTHGVATGEILRLAEPISFWGGVEPLTGIIGDIHHPNYGQSVVGKILVLEASRGSSSGAYSLMELMRAKLAPAAIVLLEPDGIICTGVLVGQETYGMQLPVIQMTSQALDSLKTGFFGEVVSEPQDAWLSLI